MSLLIGIGVVMLVGGLVGALVGTILLRSGDEPGVASGDTTSLPIGAGPESSITSGQTSAALSETSSTTPAPPTITATAPSPTAPPPTSPTAPPPPVTAATTPTTLAEPILIAPATAQASATRPAVANLRCTGNRNDFVATNLIDSNPQTGWGAGRGDGAGQRITISFDRSVLLTRIGLTPGYNRVAPRSDVGCDTVNAFSFNRYLNKVRYEFDDGTVVAADLPGVADVVWTDVFVRTKSVVIRLVETTRPAGADDDTILSDAYFEVRG